MARNSVENFFRQKEDRDAFTYTVFLLSFPFPLNRIYYIYTSLPLRTPRYLVTNTAETVRLRQFLSGLPRSLLGVSFPRSRDVEIKETFLHNDTRDDEKITFSIIEKLGY